MLKFEGIEIGTTIKAFDFEPFPGRRDRYVVGKYVRSEWDMGAKFFVIECEEDSAFTGDYNRIGLEVLIPMEMTFDYDERVTVVAEPGAPKSKLIHDLAAELGLPVIDLSIKQ